MESQHVLANNDSPEIITVKLDHDSSIPVQTGNTQDQAMGSIFVPQVTLHFCLQTSVSFENEHKDRCLKWVTKQNFLKAVFHNFYLVQSLIPYLKYSCKYMKLNLCVTNLLSVILYVLFIVSLGVTIPSSIFSSPFSCPLSLF